MSNLKKKKEMADKMIGGKSTKSGGENFRMQGKGGKAGGHGMSHKHNGPAKFNKNEDRGEDVHMNGK